MGCLVDKNASLRVSQSASNMETLAPGTLQFYNNRICWLVLQSISLVADTILWRKLNHTVQTFYRGESIDFPNVSWGARFYIEDRARRYFYCRRTCDRTGWYGLHR